MRKRAKALTVAAAMVTTFAILPTFGAAAAEPLDDGSYDVTVGESTWTVEVVDGAPVVDGLEGVEFTFDFDAETGRVLDEFDVAVDGTSYDVAVADDGTVQVTEETSDGEGADGTEESTGDGTEEEGTDGTADDGETPVEEDDGAEDESDDEDDEVEPLEEDEGEDAADDDGAHGELVSTVAQCAPGGRVARDAGLPNHGFFVSAAARGQTVEFEVDGATLTADLTTPEGAAEFCALAAELVDTVAEEGSAQEDEDVTDDDVTEDDVTEDDAAPAPEDAELEADDTGDEARGNGKGRSGDAPGRSGEAPGRAKKDR